MAVTSTPGVNSYIADGSSISYAYTFEIANATHIKVLLNEILMIFGTNYTVTGVGNTNGGTVQFTTIPPSGNRLTLLRNQPLSQIDAYQTNESYNPLKVSNGLDRTAMVDQMHQERIDRALKFKQSSGIYQSFLPQPVAGAYLTWADSFSGEVVNANPQQPIYAAGTLVSITDFGCTDGATDNYTALQAAANSGLPCFVPAGLWKTSQPVTFTHDYSGFYGVGRASRIMSTDNDTAVLTVGIGTTNVRLQNMRIDRAVPAIAGGNGVNVVNTQSHCYLGGLYVCNQYNGISLGPTDFSLVENCMAIFNYNHGVVVLNTAADGSCQWSMDNMAAFNNDATGFFIASGPGPTQMTMGTYRNITTNANSSFGLTVLANATCPIHGLRLMGGFLGGDGDNEISIESYGDQHMIRDIFVEGAGIAATGRTYQTPASNIGSGIAIGTSNIGISVDGCHSSANSGDGYVSGATDTLFTSNVARNNGQALILGRRNGFLIIAGRATLIGNRASNFGGTTQFDGIRSNVDNLLVVGNDLNGNTSAGFNQTVPVVNTVAANNR